MPAGRLKSFPGEKLMVAPTQIEQQENHKEAATNPHVYRLLF